MVTMIGPMRYTVSPTGFCAVEGRRHGRQNSVAWVVVCGTKVVCRVDAGGKVGAIARAERVDRLVALWRSL